MVCDGRGRQPFRLSLSLSLSRHVDLQYRNLPSIRRGALTGRDRERHRGGPSSNGMISNKNSNIPLLRIQAAVLFFTDINVFSASFFKPTLLSLPSSASSARARGQKSIHFLPPAPRQSNPIQSNPNYAFQSGSLGRSLSSHHCAYSWQVRPRFCVFILKKKNKFFADHLPLASLL